jgi:hypothetical protein
MPESCFAISSSVTCFVRPSVHTSITDPRSRTSTFVISGLASDAPIALDST